MASIFKMFYCSLLVFSISLSSVLSQSEYMNSQVDTILNDLSIALISANSSQVRVPDSSYNYLVFTADFQKGFIGEISSLYRSGNVNTKRLQGNKTLMISFAAKFDKLSLTYSDIDFYLILTQPINGFNMTIDLQDVETDLGLMLSRNFHDCSFSISVMSTRVGSYNTRFGGIKASFMDETILSWIADRVLSLLSGSLEQFLTGQMEPSFNRGLAGIRSTGVQKNFCNATLSTD